MAFHNSKSVKIIFLLKESTIFDEKGNLLRKLIHELLGYVKGIEIKNFLPSISVIITHCKYNSDATSKKLKAIAE